MVAVRMHVAMFQFNRMRFANIDRNELDSVFPSGAHGFQGPTLGPVIASRKAAEDQNDGLLASE